MKLYATPLSHFSRKVRILLDLNSIPYEFVDVGNVAEGTLETFADNPLLRVPVLADGPSWIIESDHIAEYIVQKVDPNDTYAVRTREISDLNIRAVLNGIMAEEVKVIIARRTSVPTDKYPFFDNALEAIENGLNWLESQASRFDVRNPKYREFHLVCAWEHLAYYELVELRHKKLKSIVSQVSEIPLIRQTSPFILKPRG